MGTLPTDGWVGLGFQGWHDSNNKTIKSGIIHGFWYKGYGRGTLHFCNNDSGNVSNVTLSDSRMCILRDGNVGIGTDTPRQKLHVNGYSFGMEQQMGI